LRCKQDSDQDSYLLDQDWSRTRKKLEPEHLWQRWSSGVAAIWIFWIYPEAADSEGTAKIGLKQ